MVGLNDFLFQIFQPYFFFSVVFLALSFVFVKVFLKFNPSISRHSQSIIWLIPLLTPVSVLMVFQPKITISTLPFISGISAPEGTGVAVASATTFFSITGLLCIGGAIIATTYLIFMTFLGQKIALKRLHVVMMAQDEYVQLQEMVKETAHMIGIPKPNVGLVDDLLPNAFTVGYGRDTVIVFSLGLLNMLKLDELGAVVSHELAHVKAKDYLFKTASYALNFLSFFNPLSYLAASYSQKNRELLADEKGAKLLPKPDLLAEVLTKVVTAVEDFPTAKFTDRLTSSLFLVSPLAHKPSILSSHPQIAQRVQNIHRVEFMPSKKYRGQIVTALLLCMLVSVSLVIGFSAVTAQETINQKQVADIVDSQSFYLYNATLPFDAAHPTGIFFAYKPDLDCFLAAVRANQPIGTLIGLIDGEVVTAGYNDNIYLDGNGAVHNFTQYPNTSGVVINGRSIVVNGKNPYLGNITYPFDLSRPKSVFLANQSNPNQPEAIGYIDEKGVSHTFQAPIIGVNFNTEITLPDLTPTNGQCSPIYAAPSPNYTNFFS